MPLSTRLASGFRRRRIMSRTARSGAALVGAITLVGTLGCGSDKSTGPAANVAGTYSIVSTDGPAGVDNSAPFVLFDSPLGADTYRIQSPGGSITLNADKTYTGTGTVDVYVNDELRPDLGVDAFSSGGTYSVTGNTVKLTPADGSDPITATLSGGNTLTVRETVAPFGTMTIVARK
jgi:hypothetical protein